MLILSRRPNEVLCIGHDVRITVLSVHGTQVRLGIEAPRSLAVDREEIYQRKHAERSALGARASLDGTATAD